MHAEPISPPTRTLRSIRASLVGALPVLPRAERGLAALSIVLGALVPIATALVVERIHPAGLWDGAYGTLRRSVREWVAATAVLAFAFHGLRHLERRHAGRIADVRLGVLALFVAVVFGRILATPLEVEIPRGDTPHWLAWVDRPMVWSSEPLGSFLHHVVYRLRYLLFGDLDRIAALQTSSIAAGVAAATMLSALVPRAFPRGDRVSLTALLLITPTFRVFSGYVETTPWAYAFALGYLALGVAYLRSGTTRAPLRESLVLAIALVTHGALCFITGAHVVLLLVYLRRGRAHSPGRRLLQAIALGLLPFSLLALGFAAAYLHPEWVGGRSWYANALGGGDGNSIVGSPFADSVPMSGWTYHYIAFEPLHRQALFSLVLATCPMVLGLPWFLRAVRRDDLPAAAFLTAATLGLALLACAWNADWGVERDYDLFAFFGLPASMIVALALERRLGRRAQRWVTLAIVPVVWGFAIAPLLTS